MICYKTDEEIELLRESNLLVSRTHSEIAKIISPGIKTIKLDKIANSEDEKIQILNNSVMNSWQGIFPLKEEEQNKQKRLYKEL